MTIKVTRKEINKIFDEAEHQADVAIGLYKLAFPDWDDITKVDGFPKVSKSMNKHIFRKFIEFDEKHHPNVIKGGLWLNNGFSSLEADHLDWEIDVSQVILTYKEKGGNHD